MFCYVAPWNKDVVANKILVSDSKQYHDVACNVVKYGTFAPPKDTNNVNKLTTYQMTGLAFRYGDTLRTPGYILFLAAIYKLFGINTWAAILFQIVVSLISIFITYRIGLLFGQKQIGTLAALLYAFDIHSIYLTDLILTETLFVALFLSAVYYFLKGIIKKGFIEMLLSSLFLGLTCLTRTVVLLYPVVLFALIIMLTKAEWKWKIKSIVGYSAIFAVLVGTWSYRNHREYNSWQLTTQGGDAIAMYNASTLKAKLTHENIDSARVDFQKQADSLGFRTKQNIFDKMAIYTTIGTQYIARHKIAYLIAHLEGGLNMFLSIGNVGMAEFFGWIKIKQAENFAEIKVDRIKQNFSNLKASLLGFFVVLILALQYIGTFICIARYKKMQCHLFLMLAISTILYFTFITGIYGMYRYRLPLTPLICLMAAYGYSYLINKSEAKND